jgi:predicted DNA-binding transcriptional regulator YafY
MPSNKDFVTRIKLIDECLRNNQKIWTLARLLKSINEKLQDQFGKSISKRTLQNDLSYLINERNAPIKNRKLNSEYSYYYEDKDFSIYELPVAEKEINLLKDAIYLLSQVHDFKLIEIVTHTINKLSRSIDTNAVKKQIVQFEKIDNIVGSEYLEPLYQAVKSSICLNISYLPFTAKKEIEFIFHPYILKEFRNRWFTIGLADNKIVNLALDRIKNISISNHGFKSNTNIELGSYFDNLVGVTIPNNKEPELIELRFSKGQAAYVTTKPIHKSQNLISKKTDGSINITIKVYDNPELRALILSFGSSVEVISPIHLRNFIKASLAKSLSKYKD